MTCKTLLLAFVAMVMCLLAASTAAESAISQNAAVRRHASMIQARPARRSIELAQGQRLQHKRQTAEQIAQAAALKAWDDEFHRKNAEWQQAALASLAKGQIPQSFDEYWNGKDDGSDSSSDSSGDGDSGNSDSSSGSDSNDSSSDSDSSDSSSGSDSSDSSSGSDSSDSSSGSDSSDSSSGSESSESSSKSGSSDSGSSDSTDSSSTPVSSSASSSPTSSPETSSVTVEAVDCDEDASTTTKSDAKQLAKATPSSTSSAAASSTASSSKTKTTGQGTYFATGLGACGQYNTDSDRIVAISHSLFDSFGTGNPNKNPVCGHKIKATYQGKSTTVTVVDRCEGCAWGDLDFTTTAFQDLAPLSVGRLYGVTWEWLGTAP